MTLPVSSVVLDDAGALRAMRDELAALAESVGAASGIVQHPDWILFELESRGGAASPHVVLVHDATGRCIGYAPFLRELHRARIGIGERQVPIYRGQVLRLLGSCVVAAVAHKADVEEAVAATLQGDRAVSVIRIQESSLPNMLAQALSKGSAHFDCIASNLLDQVNWTIQPQASSSAYLAAFEPKRRSDLTRRVRNVYKKLGDQAQLRIFDTAASIDDYCRLMNQLYARSWHAVELPIDWELPARRNLLTLLAGQQRMTGHMLMLGDRPIAYVHGYHLGGRYVLDDTGYDEEFAALGVGSTLVFQAIQDLLDRHPGEVIDFGYGDNQYKRVLANQQVPCGSLYIVRGMHARASFRMIKPLRWVYRSLRHWRQRQQRRSAR